MRAVIYLPFALSVALVGLSRLVCRSTAPRRAAWSVTAAMVVLAASTVGALGLLAWPLVARVPLIAHLGRWRPAAVNGGVPVPLVISVLALLALIAMGSRVLNQLHRLHDELMETSKLHVELPTAGAALAVLEDPVPVAHALPRTLVHPGRVVVSTGLLDALDDDERAAVLAHEHAHLAHAHRVFCVLTALATATNPLLVPARHGVAFALERWADEDAAARTSRTVAARALTKAALAKLSTLEVRVALGIDRLGVPQRVAALLDRHDRDHRRELAWLVGLVAVVGIAAVAWATHDTERLFEALRTR